MLQKYVSENMVDQKGNPTSGHATGCGMKIEWQNGPLGRDGDKKECNGAQVETVIDAVKQRLEFFQAASGGRFACEENARAIELLTFANAALNKRTKDREVRKVEGTYAA